MEYSILVSQESSVSLRVEEDSEIFNEAFKLHTLGHKDMIDNIL